MQTGNQGLILKKSFFSQQLFPLFNAVRTWQISKLHVFFSQLLSSIMYLLPILVSTYSHFPITSPSHVPIAILANFIQGFNQQGASSSTSFIIIGVLTFLVIGLIMSAKAVWTGLQQKGDCHQTKLGFFRVFVFIFRMMMFPLTNMLTIITVRQWLVNSGVGLLSLLYLGVVCWLNCCLEQALIWVDFKGEYVFGKIANYHDGWILLSKIIITNLYLIGFNSLLVEIPLLLAAFSINIYHLYFILFSVKYSSEFAQKTYILGVMLESVVLVGCLVLYLLPLTVIYENLDIFMVSIFILSCWSVRNYLNDRNVNLLLVNVEDLKAERTVFLFIFQLMKMIKMLDLKRDFEMVRGYLIIIHFKVCKNVHCFCWGYREKEIYKLSKDKTFLQKFIISQMETIRHLFSQSMIIFGLYCQFRLQENSCFSKISYMLKRLIEKRTQMTLSEEFMVYLLQGIVQEQLEEEHHEKGSVSIEKVLLDEKRKEEVIRNMQGMLDNLTTKYKLISQDLVRLDEVAIINDKINQQIRAIQAFRNQHIQSDSYSVQQDFLFIFYLDKIMPSPLERQKLKALALLKKRKIVSLEGSYLKNKLLAMYSSHACVLESLYDESLGLIVNSSHSAELVLGYEKKQLMGKNIHDIMPPFFAKAHRAMLERWNQKETFSLTHENLHEAYYVDKRFIAFSCLTQTKVHSLGSSLKIYKMLIRDNDKDYLLLSDEGRIEGIGTRLLEMKVLSSLHLHKNILSFVNDNFLAPSRWQQKVSAVICPNNIIPMVRSQSEEDIQDSLFHCRVRKKMWMLGDVSFWVVKFSSIRKTEFYHSLINLTMKISEEVIKSSRSMYGEVEEEEPKSSQQTFQEDPLQQLQEDSHNQELFDHRFELSKIVLDLKESVCRERTIPLSSRKCSTIIIFVTILAGILMMYTVEIISIVGFESTAKTIAEGNFMSSNNQLMDFLYNNALMGRVYCSTSGQQQRCQTIRRSSQIILNEFYQFFSFEVKNHLNCRGGLTGSILHEGYQNKANISIGGQIMLISTLECTELFYNWFKVAIESTGSSPQGTKAMELIVLNWQTFQELGENWIQQNKKASLREQQAIFDWIISLISGSILMAIIYFSTLKRYYSMSVSNKQDILKLYQNIGKNTAQTFRNYFASLHGQNLRSTYPKQQHKDNHDGMIGADPKKTRFIIFLIFFAIASPFYLLSIIQPFALFQPTKRAIELTQTLVWSQNALFESYLELKTFYMSYNFSKSQEEMEEEVAQHLNTTELAITNAIKSTITEFYHDDPTINQDLNNLISDNVCLLAKSLMSQWDYDYCTQLAGQRYLEKGMMTTLHAFQRGAFEALQMLRDEGKNQTFFANPTFNYMDDSLIYISRVYRLINARIVQHLQKLISAKTVVLTIVNFFDGVMCLVLLTYWVVSSRMQEQETSNIYGYVLQMPSWIITKKRVLKKIKTVLQLKLD